MARLYISLVLLGLIFPGKAQQQSLLSTSGGFYQNSAVSVSWSLGETITETFGNETYTLTQGFQQSKLGTVGINEPKESLTGAIEVFPNPTQGLVFVKLTAELLPQNEFPNRYVLYDIQGKLMELGPIPENSFILDLNSYIGAVYYLRLFNSESNTQTNIIIQKIN